MPTIAVNTFQGSMPKISPRLLNDVQASECINCNMERGFLEPLNSPLHVAPASDGIETIYKHDVDGWLSWSHDVDVVKSAIFDDVGSPLGHLFLIGEREYPTQYFSGGNIYRLGLPRPSVAPTVDLGDESVLSDTTQVYGVGAEDSSQFPARYGIDILPNVSGDGSEVYATSETSEDVGIEPENDNIERSTAYVYTLVRYLEGSIFQQESAPSPASRVVDVLEGEGVIISGFVLPDVENLGVTHIRIYRTVSGYSTSEFYFLAELEYTENLEYLDTTHDVNISLEVMRTTTWDSIPDDTKGLIKTDNGIYAAYRNNELLLSEPFIPYAFPESYRLTFENEIVGLGHVDSTIIIMTTGRPYLAVGSVPESMQVVHLPIEQSCVSKKSIASLSGGVVYASPDGLMLMTASEQTLVSINTFTRAQWQALQPQNIIATIHDGKYIAFFKGTNTGFYYSIGMNNVVKIQLEKEAVVQSMYHDSRDDAVYLGISLNGVDGIYQNEGGEPLEYTWRSKDFFTSALVGIGTVRVEADYIGLDKSVSMTIFTPGKQGRKCILKLRNSKAVRLPQLLTEKLWSFELKSRNTVHEVRLGTSIQGLNYGD